MRINLLSSFAAGILITTTICGAVYFTDNSDVQKASAKTSEKQSTVNVQPSENEMVDQLASKGYVVQTKDQYDKNLKDAKASGEKQDSSKDNETTKNVTRVIINVSDGMTSIDVGNMLETAKMIPNAFDFSNDIEKKGLQNNLRPGVFVVDSEMTIDQVISTIFK
jgi:cell division protein YceG involved in septum cleavage